LTIENRIKNNDEIDLIIQKDVIKTMNALVTGCAGFIGSSITDQLLAQGYTVIGIDCFTDYYPIEIKKRNLGSALQQDNFTFIESDLLDINKFPDVDYVFHQAAQAGVRASWGESFEVYTRNNILATQKLLEYYKDKKLKKFVYASSSSIYGDVDVFPIKEDTPKKPVSPYGVSKLAAENLCYLYHVNYGLPAVALRYFTVYGPRQRPDMGIYKFIKAALNGSEITIYGDGKQTRDFTYISDIVKANIQATKCKSDWACLNIGGGSRISVNDLLKLIENKTGHKLNIKYAQNQKGDVEHTYADVSAAKDIIGYIPEINIEAGIGKHVEFLRDEV
jgi:UDP-glucose 4-epimerase